MKTVLITGASGGIGKEFAQLFAKKGYDLALVARSKAKLEEISRQLQKEHSIHATVISCDLSKPESAEKLHSEIKERDIQIDILINNAGFGDFGKFVDSEPDRITNMMNLNMITLTNLSLLFLKEMKIRNQGKILNIASTAAFQPLPKFAVYAATKTYVLHFTEALHYELRGTNISASALCPGPTSTGFEESANMKGSKLFSSGVMDAKAVAQIGYDGLMKNEMTIVPGLKNKILSFFSNLTPSRKMVVRMAGKIT